MTELRSLRIPRSTVQKIAAVWRWLAPSVLTGLLTVAGFSWRWFDTRASRTEVADAVGSAIVIADAANASALTGSSMAKEHAHQIAAMWRLIIELNAEQMVWRQYSRQEPATRNAYIEAAKKFYAREWELQLSNRRNDPAEAARLTLLAQWRPDR